MNFGQAIEALKEGKIVRRTGWNGKGMFLFIRPEFVCDIETFKKIVSVPDNAKELIVTSTYDIYNPTFKFTGYISMFAADKSIVNGWLASQTDMLSEDWEVIL
jgi:hypothetical protein